MKPKMTTLAVTALLLAGPLTAIADQNPRGETPKTRQQQAQTFGAGLCVPGIPTADTPPGNPCPPGYIPRTPPGTAPIPPGATDLGGDTSKEKPGGAVEPGSPTTPNGAGGLPGERKQPGTAGKTGQIGGDTPIR